MQKHSSLRVWAKKWAISVFDPRNHPCPTVLQNRVNPKSNAPEISKGATKLERNFQHKSEISQKSNDIRLRKVTFKGNLLWSTSNFHKNRPLKKCSNTSDGISVTTFSWAFSTCSQFFISTTSSWETENVIFELKLNEQSLYPFK